MSDNTKLPFNLSLLELISLLGFVSLGYSLLYKTSFYFTLGLPWYINNFTTQSLFFSSIKIIFISVPIALLGWWLGRNINKTLGLILIVFLFSFMSFCMITEYIIPLESVPYVMIFSYIFVMQGDFFKPTSYLHPSDNKLKLYSKKFQIYIKISNFFRSSLEYLNKTLISACFVASFIAAPTLLGAFQADEIIKNKKKLLNEVSLNNEKTIWYIVDSSSDKFLLINDLNNFKLVGSTDIKEFKRIE